MRRTISHAVTFGAVGVLQLLVSCSESHRSRRESTPVTEYHVPEHTREGLRQAFLGTPDLPPRLPDEVRDVADPYLGPATRLVTWTDDLSSVGYFVPTEFGTRVPRLAVYHQGHTGDARIFGIETIDALRAADFAVLVLSMPMRGENEHPFPDQSHFHLADRDHALRYFLDPIAVALNWAHALHRWADIRMVGISGGGWSTAVYAAIDERIDRSWAVAGTWPQWLIRDYSGGSDYEHHLTSGYQLDMYALASHPTHVMNLEDPCCYAGKHYDGYGEMIQGLKIIIDDHDEHSISDSIRRLIVK